VQQSVSVKLLEVRAGCTSFVQVSLIFISFFLRDSKQTATDSAESFQKIISSTAKLG